MGGERLDRDRRTVREGEDVDRDAHGDRAAAALGEAVGKDREVGGEAGADVDDAGRAAGARRGALDCCSAIGKLDSSRVVRPSLGIAFPAGGRSHVWGCLRERIRTIPTAVPKSPDGVASWLGGSPLPGSWGATWPTGHSSAATPPTGVWATGHRPLPHLPHRQAGPPVRPLQVPCNAGSCVPERFSR
ncbi:hypothetical protein UK12_23485 [Saccharothrix sp. ST-888]|nr:hypothetical protein UK12_23485 [Saccharothrix sp. ST-888]